MIEFCFHIFTFLNSEIETVIRSCNNYNYHGSLSLVGQVDGLVGLHQWVLQLQSNEIISSSPIDLDWQNRLASFC